MNGSLVPGRWPAQSRPDPHTTRAVILAGGRGTRLAPYTSVLPKPLMPIGERAILEIVVEQLELNEFIDITFSVGYLSHLIRAVFDNTTLDRAAISYSHEESALGTAGPLRHIDRLDRTFLAMNGDVLTNLDYRNLVRHHAASGNILTIATHERRVKLDYGILDVANGRVEGFQEKPEMTPTVSMGVYVFEPAALAYVPPDGYFDFPDLVKALLSAHEPVGAYSFDGLWFDIGRPGDYEEAAASWVDEPLASLDLTLQRAVGEGQA